MTEHPILFSAEMVRAILGGRKTQTRRPMKPQPDPAFLARGVVGIVPQWPQQDGMSELIAAPYAPGDTLWVRETWRCTGGSDWKGIIYRADAGQHSCQAAYEALGLDTLGRLTLPKSLWPEWDRLVYKTRVSTGWRPSTHMPRWAPRINLEVTAVRVERVQDITLSDVRAEGVPETWGDWLGTQPDMEPHEWDNMRWDEQWEYRWDSICAKRGNGWDANPWVWVVEHPTFGKPR